MWWNETPLFLHLLKGIFSTFGAIVFYFSFCGLPSVGGIRHPPSA